MDRRATLMSVKRKSDKQDSTVYIPGWRRTERGDEQTAYEEHDVTPDPDVADELIQHLPPSAISSRREKWCEL